MDTSCNTNCAAPGEVTSGYNLAVVNSEGGDVCPDKLINDGGDYGAIAIYPDADEVELFNGSSGDPIVLPLQQNYYIPSILTSSGSHGVIKRLHPPKDLENKRIIVRDGSFVFAGDTFPALLPNDIDYELGADFILGANKTSKICSPGVTGPISLKKIAVDFDAPVIIAVPNVMSMDAEGDASVNVLTNDTGDTLTILSFTQPTNGTVTNEGGGVLKYVADALFAGSDSFTYTIEDEHGQTATTTVGVTVIAPAISAVADTIETDYETLVSFNPRTNDTGTGLEITAVSNPPNGTATITGGGTAISYTPDNGYDGADSFTYTITDDYGSTATATVSVTVNAAVGGGGELSPSGCNAGCSTTEIYNRVRPTTAETALEAWINMRCMTGVADGDPISSVVEASSRGLIFEVAGTGLPEVDGTGASAGILFTGNQTLECLSVPISSVALTSLPLSAIVVFSLDTAIADANTPVFEVTIGGNKLKLSLTFDSGVDWYLNYEYKGITSSELWFIDNATDKKHIFVGPGFLSASNLMLSHRVAGVGAGDDSLGDHNEFFGTSPGDTFGFTDPFNVDIVLGGKIGLKIHEFILFSTSLNYDPTFNPNLISCVNGRWA